MSCVRWGLEILITHPIPLHARSWTCRYHNTKTRPSPLLPSSFLLGDFRRGRRSNQWPDQISSGARVAVTCLKTSVAPLVHYR